MWSKLKETLKNKNWKEYTTNLSKSFANAAALATKQKKPYELKEVDFDLDKKEEKNV